MPQATQVKILVLILATSALVIGANKKAQKVILDRLSYIYYQVQFQKDEE